MRAAGFVFLGLMFGIGAPAVGQSARNSLVVAEGVDLALLSRVEDRMIHVERELKLSATGLLFSGSWTFEEFARMTTPDGAGSEQERFSGAQWQSMDATISYHGEFRYRSINELSRFDVFGVMTTDPNPAEIPAANFRSPTAGVLAWPGVKAPVRLPRTAEDLHGPFNGKIPVIAPDGVAAQFLAWPWPGGLRPRVETPIHVRSIEGQFNGIDDVIILLERDAVIREPAVMLSGRRLTLAASAGYRVSRMERINRGALVYVAEIQWKRLDQPSVWIPISVTDKSFAINRPDTTGIVRWQRSVNVDPQTLRFGPTAVDRDELIATAETLSALEVDAARMVEITTGPTGLAAVPVGYRVAFGIFTTLAAILLLVRFGWLSKGRLTSLRRSATS